MADYQHNYPPCMVLRPIEHWPTTRNVSRRDAPFRAALGNTLALLDREMRCIDPDDPEYPPSVLQVALRERDFRVDGMPRADAKPEHPGVILSVEPRGRPAVSFPCDTFWHWHDNLRAIVLTLEALRKMDRYGVTQNGQQYRGWHAIESRATTVDARSAACSLIARVAWPNERPEQQGEWANKIATDPEIARTTYRQARAKAHPDRHNGDRWIWDQIAAAGMLLGLHH